MSDGTREKPEKNRNPAPRDKRRRGKVVIRVEERLVVTARTTLWVTSRGR